MKVPSVKARFPSWYLGEVFIVFSRIYFFFSLAVFCQAEAWKSLWVNAKKIILFWGRKWMRGKERKKNFSSPFFAFNVVWKSTAGKRKGNLHSQKKRETEEWERRKMLLNIIEKTCCINDFFRSLLFNRCCFIIYYFFRVQRILPRVVT